MNKYVDIRGKNVLAVGCNTGLECDLLIRMGAKEVTGLDVIKDIGKEYPHPRIRYVRCSAETAKELSRVHKGKKTVAAYRNNI